MSLRNIRKIYGSNTLPPPENSSDEEYEPLYAKSTKKSSYEVLISSSPSENENEVEQEEDEQEEEQEETKKKKKKKKRKRNKSQNKEQKLSETTEDLENIEELDEIDRSVMEVNAILGKPATPPPVKEGPTDQAKVIMEVKHKHLNYTNERFLGFKPPKPDKKSKKISKHQQRLINAVYPSHVRKNSIVPLEKYTPITKRQNGLSMSIVRREKGYTYYVYDHNREYRNNHAWLLQISKYSAPTIYAALLEEAQDTRHVEALLECADEMFRFEEYTYGNTLIEQSLLYIQYAAHPMFNLADMRTRLEYKYLENRTFHVVMLKYLHLLTNRACHRTALELAKVLLNLDPSDPLAVVFIIDTIALRAREHEWLIQAVDHWKIERGAGFLFNVQYSYAMAKFHVAKKNEADTAEADELLLMAMRQFPFVLKKLLESLNLGQKTHLREHELFETMADRWTKNELKGVLSLYTNLCCSKWREPIVAEWLIRMTEDLLKKYDTDKQFKDETRIMIYQQYSLYRDLPQEMLRHLCVIKPMEKLLTDGEIPEVPWFRSCDPLPPKNGVDRYGYEQALRTNLHSGSPFVELLSSLLPGYQMQQEEGGAAAAAAGAPAPQGQEIAEYLMRRMQQRFQEWAGAANEGGGPARAGRDIAQAHAQMVDLMAQAAANNLHINDTESEED